MEPNIKIFVGTPEESVEDFLYAQLEVDSRELVLFESSSSVNNLGKDGLVDMFCEALNEALLFSRELFLEIILDESLEDVAEEIEENLFRRLEKILADTE